MTDNPLPQLDVCLGSARVYTTGNTLTADTGLMTRTWKWIGNGFSTTKVTEKPSGSSWTKENGLCDWQMPDATEPPAAEIVSLVALPGNDEGFTSEHLCVTADIRYPSLDVRLVVWVYPGTPGIRTHLSARLGEIRTSKKEDGPPLQGGGDFARIDTLPLGSTDCRRRLFGYYNDTQNRNDTSMDILKEHVLEHPLSGREFCPWASAMCVETSASGIAMVKESHKCVNQKGHNAGEFTCDEENGIVNTGWGLREDEVRADRFSNAWGSWCIVWSGGDFERQTAFKAFDKARYPIDPERDIYVQANTWGSTPSGAEARNAAGEASVLEEIEVCRELGIDCLQIDDGWQVPADSPSWNPGDNGWHPHPEKYPEGWKNVKAKAEECGVGLSLWAPATAISEEELVENFEEVGFKQFKLDFAVLKSRDEIDDLMIKVRNFVVRTGHKVRINWDVTEVSPRYGYFFAREYGCIYLSNRKPVRPQSVVYRPHTNLRDWWQISRYLNLHRFQCSIQNVDMVDKERSDAHLHSHAYCVAAALMGIPLFFLETKFYSEAARAEVRKVLDAYRPHRDAIYSGNVCPVGSKPNNASWTGFQCIVDDASGYLTIFRERCCQSETGSIDLHRAGGKTLELTNLMTGDTTVHQAGPEGTINFTIPVAPGFIFASYRVQ